MRETKFIEKNKDKWIEFEEVLASKDQDPEKLSELFTELTDDLSYSRTFYPNRSVRVYLNNISQAVFDSIYKNRKSRWKRFLQFWSKDLPQLIYESRVDFLLSFAIFILAVGIGVFSSIMDPDFPRVILGDGYVEMTYENIRKGEPMSVYQDEDQTGMFMRIAWNNLRVAFGTFILGLLFGVGTIYILIQNGIMVGAFQFLFIREGIYWDSILTIWLHGAVEISCIIIAGAAGLHLGRALLFPGTYSRLQSLQLAARRALSIYMAIVPLIILAAFIEGYITRYSDASYVVRAILIIASFVFMGGYFVWYPWRVGRRQQTAEEDELELPVAKEVPINLKMIKNQGQVFMDAFKLYRQQLLRLALGAAAMAFVYTAVSIKMEYYFEFHQAGFLFSFFEALAYTGYHIAQFLFLEELGLRWLLNVGAMSVILHIALSGVSAKANGPMSWAKHALLYPNALLASALMNFLFISYGNEDYYIMIFLYLLFVIPILAHGLALSYNEQKNLIVSIPLWFKHLGKNYLSMMGNYVVGVLMSFIFLFLTTAPLVDFYFNSFMTLLPISEEGAQLYYTSFNLFLHGFSLCFMFPLVFLVMSIGERSYKQTVAAEDLFDHIGQLGQQKKSYGMERE